MLEGKRVLLIVAGGIAAYKSLELVRRLRERGVHVRAVLTRGGSQFVTPLSLSALTEDKVYTDLFSLTDESEMGHIRLSREADLVVVAPATADLMAKMAHGHADDLASTVLLATDKPVLIAPAMNVEMWDHPAVERNAAQLRADGIHMIGPNPGMLACGEVGAGRMSEPMEILAAISQLLVAAPAGDRAGDLKGRRALITSGPTYEAIDPVRYLANRSSGKQGHAIAAALARRGADTVLVSGPTNLPPPAGVNVVHVESAREMLDACETALPADIAIFAAAVADWHVAEAAGQKLKKTGKNQPPALKLVENPDILATIAHMKTGRPKLVVGFAAETNDVVAYAQDKRARKACDWIVANDVSGDVMGGDENAVHLITAEGVDDWPRMSKQAVADQLAGRIAAHFAQSALSS
ncbi:MAG: bifunctional phosphopantothenoylcysteine decarboxylase/phosphopantothenate--cysteine ligase CoaBC [Alphaproteobacteria bacterium]